MLLSKDRCNKCRSERGVRNCPRLHKKTIGWNCCNDLRVDLCCPSQCPYAAQPDSARISPIPAFRADSNTEFIQAAKRFIDLWCYQPLPELDDASPHAYAQNDPAKALSWLSQYQYPANFPIAYLMRKLGIEHSPAPEPETPETVAMAWMEAVIAREWNSLRSFTANAVELFDWSSRYERLLASVRSLVKARSFSLLHAGSADDGVSAIVALELNRNKLWTVLLSSASGHWKIRQNLDGAPDLYYAQNALFRKLADALANGRDSEVWDLLQTNLPLYPDCADLYYYRSFYWQLTKQTGKVIEDLQSALALDNHYFAAGYALATIYLNEKDLNSACQLLTHLNSIRPDDLNVRNNLAACYAGMGDTARAVAIWQEILKTAPTYELARKNLERYQA